ncbi:MAG: type 4a pilus biogenesis protein PilO [Gammaproteobacteria bacterium]
MNFSDINELDFKNIGGWPAPARIGLIVILSVAILGAGYWFDTQHQLQALKDTQAKELELKQSFEIKQAKATNLEAYTLQLQDMKKTFGAMLRQLPSKAEVADLLVDISQTGLASGLEFELFSPKAEVPKDFYAELPISIRVTGSYHQLGTFVSGVAALPRIVTLHDTLITRPDKSEKLAMEVTAKTYRYLDEPAPAANAPAGQEPAK